MENTLAKIFDIMRASGLPRCAVTPFLPDSLHTGKVLPYGGDDYTPRCIIVCVVPYYAGSAPGNIALYARGADYHTVLGGRLRAACRELSAAFAHAAFRPFCDASPVREVVAAARAGLGRIGRHGLLITPEHGSYVFIGEIVTDLPLLCDAPQSAAYGDGCGDCRECLRACPSGALGGDGLLRERCVSWITRMRDPSPEQLRLARGAGYVRGCDICQLACPQNRDAAHTSEPEFCEGLIAYRR